ncbi:hypothetical protein HI914_07362 [Erysiphe necator]|nr:hypothetical protein HI914_07362 [Erysiphe necator]
MSPGKELDDITLNDESKSLNLDNKSESGKKESNILFREKLKCQELRHQLKIERMRSEMLELRLAVKQNDSNGKETTSVQQAESQNLKLKPIAWPVAYDHKDRTIWNTIHGLLQYIFQREVIQRKFLEPSDFFMNLFSHAVTGVAKGMITGKFQEILS